jgi:arylsulfatase A-like enzyme
MAFRRDSIATDNLCVIWIDDLIDVFTWRDAFGLRIETPAIDRLMAEGVRFANAYATVPLCAPCRAELATGLSPFRTGLVDLNRFWRDVLPPTAAWAFDLRRAGFRMFTTGKVDANYRPMPKDYARLLFHADPLCADNSNRARVKDYLGRGPGIRGVNHPDDDGTQDDRFYDFHVAENAIRHLERLDPARRHLIQLGFKHPHYNLECPDRFYQRYDPTRIRWPASAHPDDRTGPQPGMAVYEAAYITNGNWTPERAGDEGWRQVVRAYFAAVSHVDHEIGRFLDALRSSEIGQRTSVILLSDNGFNLGTHDSFHKMSQWDSAAHVPLGLWSARMEGQGRVIDLPVSLHNFPATIMDLAGLPRRPDWVSGQSLLPLIDPSFGRFDRGLSPVTSVFGTLSVRPSTEGLTQYRYFRYPTGEEHVFDLVADPGETRNLIGTEGAPTAALRAELAAGAARLGLDLGGLGHGADGMNAMMAVDGSVVLEGGSGDSDYWAYGEAAANIREARDGGRDTLWYMAGPDAYTLHVPANIERVRIATVVARNERAGGRAKTLRIVAHPDSPIEFETSERVTVNVTGSRGDDVLIGARYASTTYHGGAGNDQLLAVSQRGSTRHFFYGGAGQDTLRGGAGRDVLDGGTGDDLILGGPDGANRITAGHGNDTIVDGKGSSLIRTGPGRNHVTTGGGDDTVIVGAGETDILPGPGRVVVRVAYGGITRIAAWRPEYVLDLSDWPAAPRVQVTGTGLLLSLGLTFVEISGPKSVEAITFGQGAAPAAGDSGEADDTDEPADEPSEDDEGGE